jgi:predicted secreted protein
MHAPQAPSEGAYGACIPVTIFDTVAQERVKSCRLLFIKHPLADFLKRYFFTVH